MAQLLRGALVLQLEMSMFLPIAAVLALQVWLSMTDRFESEIARAAAVVPSFLVLCILGGDETVTEQPQLGAAEPPQGSWWGSSWGSDGAGGAPQSPGAARAPSGPRSPAFSPVVRGYPAPGYASSAGVPRRAHEAGPSSSPLPARELVGSRTKWPEFR